MKIVCAYLCDYRDRNDYFISLLPTGVPSLAASLERGHHQVVLANLSRYGAAKGARIILREKPEAVAVSIFSFNRTESFHLIRELKRKDENLLIIAGGQHPTFLPGQILSEYPEIDYIVKGEGEAALLELLDDLGRRPRRSVVAKERIADLDSLPIPALFTGKTIGVDPHEQFRYIITTRGCPAKCRYCSSPHFWKRKVTYRSPSHIVAELKTIQEKYGIIDFSIRDDNFTLHKGRVLEFCRLLSASGIYMMWNCQARVDTVDLEMLIAMKQCGLEHIQFGVESGSERMLRLYDKSTSLEKIRRASEATRRAGITLSFYLMAGMEDEEDADIDDTIALLRSALPHDVIVSPVAYYPGTEIYNRAIAKGRISDAIWNGKDDTGMYVLDKKKSRRWIRRLLQESRVVSLKADYKAGDFTAHRRTAGEDCWMTDLLEGDFQLESGNLKQAVTLYEKVIDRCPGNIWGYLKTAEALAETAPVAAITLFKKAARRVPSYHGAWLRIAQLEYEANQFARSRESAEKALLLNPHDRETIAFIRESGFLQRHSKKPIHADRENRRFADRDP